MIRLTDAELDQLMTLSADQADGGAVPSALAELKQRRQADPTAEDEALASFILERLIYLLPKYELFTASATIEDLIDRLRDETPGGDGRGAFAQMHRILIGVLDEAKHWREDHSTATSRQRMLDWFKNRQTEEAKDARS